MDSRPDGRQQGALGALVAFDFDGTLTTRDSFIAFLAWRSGWLAFAAGLVALAPAILRWLVDRDRGRIKAAAVRRFLRGAPMDELRAQAESFAEDAGRGLLRQDAVACWRSWRDKGARLVIVTASPDIVVAPFARRLGADLLIGTRLAFDSEGRVAGTLDGANCRGAEKVRRLREALGDQIRLEAAYGDTDGDREMLTLAREQGFKVFRGKGGGEP